jgi:hypothetical protein
MDALGWGFRAALIVLAKVIAGLLGVRRAVDAKRREARASRRSVVLRIFAAAGVVAIGARVPS